MNPQREEDLHHPLQKLEEEINSSSFKVVVNQSQRQQMSESGFGDWKSHLEKLTIWFNSLSGMGKLTVLGVAVLFGLAMLQAMLKLVTSVISLALLAGLVYVGYKFFVSSSFEHKQ